MALSNTAVPRYYGEFREKVLKGEIAVNREIEMEMNRIDYLIKSPIYYYDPCPVEGYIRFCEHELTLTDGSPVKMLPSFKLWAEQLRGWYYFQVRTVPIPNPDGHGTIYVKKRYKKRLINKQYIVSGRGSAKTMHISFNQAYELIINQKTTHQLTMVPTMKHAEEVLSPIATAIVRSDGPLLNYMTEGSIQNTTGNRANRPKLASTKKGIQNFMTNSLLEVRRMSIEAGQGFRGPFASVDEWLSCDIREDPTTGIEQATSKNEDWWIIETSSEGTVRNAVGDTIKIELMKILKGEYVNPHVSIWWYKLDDIHEINDPNMWVKANPNIGLTVSYETYQQDVKTAENVPEKRNDILAKRFGLPMEGYTYYFTFEETFKAMDSAGNYRQLYFNNMDCALGADLSRGDDFCAFTFLFPLPREQYGIKTICFITTKTLHSLPSAMRNKYEDFMREGSLRVIDGTVLQIDQLYEEIEEYINDNDYNVVAFGYDPYYAKEFVDLWVQNHGPYNIEVVKQGARTESVPLGEIKKLAEQRALLFDQEIMSYCMQHCIAITDTNGNRKLSKKRADEKIDSVAAMMDAYVAYKANKEQFE
jgi:phage terminase large subunit-like protein